MKKLTLLPGKQPKKRDESNGFDPWDPEVLRRIDELIEKALPDRPVGRDNSDLVQQLVVTALKTYHSQLSRGDMKILSRALRELRYGFRIFRPYRNRRKVTIFGSARTPGTHAEYKQAKQFAHQMAKAGFMSITGAGPGIMQAGNEGAGKGNSFGINIRLPYEQSANEFIQKDPLFIDCRFFFTRKLMFLKETSAVAFFPGGFGTLDEAMETLTLVQTGKADMMPIVFIDRPGGRYWKDWMKYLDTHLRKPGKISPEDVHLFKITDKVSDAVKEILGFFRNYHSMRFVGDDLVLRLKKPVNLALLQELQKKFGDILTEGGTFRASPALPEEEEHRELPRLIFPFNRLNYGKLRLLIDRLNRL